MSNQQTWTGKDIADIPDDVLAVIFPAREVVFGSAPTEVRIKVRGIELADLREFQHKVVKVFTEADQFWDALRTKADGLVVGRVIVSTLTPFVLTDLFELVQRCCSHKLDRLPHYALAQVTDAWLMESFGSPERFKPWMELAKNLSTAFSSDGVRGILGTLSQPSDKPVSETTNSGG